MINVLNAYGSFDLSNLGDTANEVDIARMGAVHVGQCASDISTSSSSSTTCAILADGSPRCWGVNV